MQEPAPYSRNRNINYKRGATGTERYKFPTMLKKVEGKRERGNRRKDPGSEGTSLWCVSLLRGGKERASRVPSRLTRRGNRDAARRRRKRRRRTERRVEMTENTIRTLEERLVPIY
ncbi:hypothetical protein K0M31_007557 [Melipona bicolor]|uniref:Uncharacterized protein n=1 Tax=Melipona bicolor TaxID=60889 RepID=A0AA40GBY0_9HYME|nr:hypothetical protein K0M31_007557 [Melipona bicolor]